MDDLELVKKIPAAAEEIGKAAVALEEATGLFGATLLKLKAVQMAQLAASKRLREAMDEMRARAAEAKRKGN